MEFHPSFSELFSKSPNAIILVFLPIFAFTILAEALVIQARHGSYSWKNTGVSTLVAVGRLISQAALHGVIIGIIAAGVYAVRLTTIPVSFHNWPSVVALFLLTDLAFYVDHRCSHRIRLMWASHSVHHSTDRMVTSAAFRLAWTPILSGVVLFYLPIVWIGYDPVWVYGVVSTSLTYQFFVHTEFGPHVRWLEWVINTPSAHRVHHASNPEYLDKNYGGVPLIWDHLFSSYQAELPHIPIRYGLMHERSAPDNPFVIAYEELWLTLKATLQAPTWRQGLARLFGPP